MKNINKIAKAISLYLFIVIFFNNCSTSILVQKRQYRNGYNISISKNKKEENKSAEQKTIKNTSYESKTQGQSKDILCLIEINKQNEACFENTKTTKQPNNTEKVKQSIKNESPKKSFTKTVNLPTAFKKKQLENKENNANDFIFFASIISVAGAFAFLKTKKSKQISAWANTNKTKARILLIFAQIAAASQAIYIGNLLREEEIILSKNTVWIALSGSILACLLYPFKNTKLKLFNRNYFTKKAIELVVIIGTFFSILAIGNQNEISLASKTEIQNTSSQQVQNERKTKAQELHSTKADNGSKIALLALATIISLGLLLLIAVLSCDLACTGAVGTFILLVGTTFSAILLGYIFLSKRILFKKNSTQSSDKKTSRILIPIALGLSVAFVLLLLLTPPSWPTLGALAFLAQKYWIIATIYSILATIGAILYK